MDHPVDRDRLRELLDAVLDEENATLGAMADDVHSSRYHFNRRFRRDTGEPPVTMRRRVMLERAAWQLAHGSSVTDAAWAAGYDSVEGFSRAFQRGYGYSPGQQPVDARPWLPAPNGIHFHPPTSLWVEAGERHSDPLTEILVRHDLDDTSVLLDLAKQLSHEQWQAPRLPGLVVISWDGVEESIAALLSRQVHTKELWLASVHGEDWPAVDAAVTVADVIAQHRRVAPRWLAAVRDIEARGAWDDRLVDALCEPPESFVLSGVVAHVLTFAAQRRQLTRTMLRMAGVEVDDGDPITWQRDRYRQEES